MFGRIKPQGQWGDNDLLPTSMVLESSRGNRKFVNCCSTSALKPELFDSFNKRSGRDDRMEILWIKMSKNSVVKAHFRLDYKNIRFKRMLRPSKIDFIIHPKSTRFFTIRRLLNRIDVHSIGRQLRRHKLIAWWHATISARSICQTIRSVTWIRVIKFWYHSSGLINGWKLPPILKITRFRLIFIKVIAFKTNFP